MNILELDSYKLSDAVKFNQRLNPKIWGPDEKMLPAVREQLLKITDDFREFLGVSDFELKDITVSGSNAAYTYTPHSDIDLHLVVDLPKADQSEVYRELFDAKKYQYNDMHDFKIGGYDVELYVQNANQPHHSQGIYSVLNNEWVDVPKRRRPTVDDISIRSKYEDVKKRIDTAIESGNFDTMNLMAAKIKEMRQAGLDQHGEFGPENLAFKMLRSQGKIEELYAARNAARDTELSLKERERIRAPVTYGFKTEDVGMSWDGVSPETCMFTDDVDNHPSDEEILKDFIDFCVKELKIESMPTIKLKRDPQWSVVHKTFGRYINGKHLLEVAWGQRHVMDVLRTVAHELTHRHQHERDGSAMGPEAGETGSKWENEANARAGILMRDYARLHPDYFAIGQAEKLHMDESASGYIPTRKQARDPRYSMALTVDIKPGAVGKNANKLKLNTNSQGQPQLANPNGMVQRMKEQLEAFKQGIILESEELDEVKMSPSALKKFADSPAARGILVGFEAEMIVPDVRVEDSDPEWEADYDMDERCTSLDQVIRFFEGGDFGPSSRQLERLRDQLDEKYYEWYDDQMYRDFREDADELVKKVLVDEEWNWDDEVRKQLVLQGIEGADQDATMQAGAEAPKFKTTAEQAAYMAEHPEYEVYIKAYEEAEDLLDELVQDEVRTQDKIWDQALEDFRDNYQLNDDSGFFDDVSLRWMSDIANEFDLEWPYLIDTNEGNGSMDVEEVADSLSDAIGMKVVASSSYHGAPRKPGQFIIEPDSSLSPDGSEDAGLEIISPPMPIDEAIEKLNQVIEWAQARGCYTNSSTGLHMGVSLPGQKSFAEDAETELDPAEQADKPIDFMKLALFLGDQHVLKEFGRSANSYCRSSLEKLKEKRWSPEQIAKAMTKMRGNLINLAYKDLADRSPGRDSINMKDNYVEFRGAGGDYLSRESDEGMDFLENTLLRYVQALSIAGDPDAYRDEYAKKLYKLISPEGDNTLDLFSKFATGEIDKDQLKTTWAQRTLEKEKPTDDEIEWEAYDSNTGEVLGTTKNFSRTNAVNYFRDEMKLNDFMVREKEPEPTTSRAKFAKKIIQNPKQKPSTNTNPTAAIANQVRMPNGVPVWLLFDVDTGSVLKEIPDHTAREAYTQGMTWLRSIGAENPETYGERFAIKPKMQTGSADWRRDLEHHVQDATMDVAQNFAAPLDATEQVGSWSIYDVTLGRELSRMDDVTWNQASDRAEEIERATGHNISVRGLSENIEEGWKQTIGSLATAGALAAGGTAGLKMAEPATSTQPTPTVAAPAQHQGLEDILKQTAHAAGIRGAELAQFMAQCAHETANFTKMKEMGTAKTFARYDPVHNPAKARRLGNVKAGDGARYHGRGFIQLTGRDNYRRAGKALGIDLEQFPELALKPNVAAQIAIWYWKNRVQPKVQNFQDVKATTRAINPGMKGLKSREQQFKNYQVAQNESE